MLKTIRGNLITLAKQGQFDAIAHGCNCFNNMGAGIAKSIKQEFPEAYEVDYNTVKGDKRKLGGYTEVFIPEYDLIVFNLYTQYHYGMGKANIDYRALAQCMEKLSIDYPNLIIGMPKIGAGLAGGDWSKIEPIIERYLPNTIIVEWDGS